jgi:hypothetical protein
LEFSILRNGKQKKTKRGINPPHLLAEDAKEVALRKATSSRLDIDRRYGVMRVVEAMEHSIMAIRRDHIGSETRRVAKRAVKGFFGHARAVLRGREADMAPGDW